jgi:non-ribosomal peptide synthase protein (TIGR01720 family)
MSAELRCFSSNSEDDTLKTHGYLQSSRKALLIKRLSEIKKNKAGLMADQTGKETVAGEFPLTPAQHSFFSTNFLFPSKVITTQCFNVFSNVDEEKLKTAYKSIIMHHYALQLRFFQDHDGWKQKITEADNELSFTVMDLSDFSDREMDYKLGEICCRVRDSFDIENGPLTWMTLIRRGFKKSGILVWIIHHLLVDGFSWRILMEDLMMVYKQLMDGKPVQMEPKTDSYTKWALLLVEKTRNKMFDSEKKFWLKPERSEVKKLPRDFYGTQNTVQSEEKCEYTLDFENTSVLLKKSRTVFHAQIDEMLLAVLYLVIFQWTGQHKLLVDLETHGREKIDHTIDLTRSVGWFNTHVPMFFNITCKEDSFGIFKNALEQIQSVPTRGIGYGALRYLAENKKLREELQEMPRAEINLNYMGQFQHTSSDSTFEYYQSDGKAEQKEAGENPILKTDMKTTEFRKYIMNICVLCFDNKLRIEWFFSKNLYRRTTVEKLINQYIDTLKLVVGFSKML